MAGAGAHINPDVLTWARRQVNADPKQVARRLNTSLARYQDWESGEARPTQRQLRLLAKYLGRPVGQFYLDDVPDETSPRFDMRRVPGGTATTDSFELARQIQSLAQRRRTALDLYDRIGVEPPALPSARSRSDDPERVGAWIREDVAGISKEVLTSWTNAYEPLRTWRGALEDAGILSFQMSRISIDEARGLCIADRPLPVVAVNSADSLTGRLFTLLHEVAHALLGESVLHAQVPLVLNAKAERWCNHVAAAALIPRDDVLEHPLVVQYGPSASWSTTDVETLARRYSVSPAAMVRRLDRFDRIGQSAYAAMAEEFDARRAKARAPSSGGSIGFYNPQLARLGRLLPRLAFQGFYEDKISAGDLASIMGTKVDNLGTFEEKVMGSRYAFAPK